MARPLFTPEELEQLRRDDEELDESFVQTQEEIAQSRQRDKDAIFDRLDTKGRKIAENKRAYREANREKIAENQRAYREANREKYNEYMRNYLAKKRAAAAVQKGCTVL